MQVKTRITNLSSGMLKLGWMPKHGLLLAGGASTTIDGDIYTLLNNRGRALLNKSEKALKGKLLIELLTDVAVNGLDSAAPVVVQEEKTPNDSDEDSAEDTGPASGQDNNPDVEGHKEEAIVMTGLPEDPNNLDLPGESADFDEGFNDGAMYDEHGNEVIEKPIVDVSDALIGKDDGLGDLETGASPVVEPKADEEEGVVIEIPNYTKTALKGMAADKVATIALDLGIDAMGLNKQKQINAIYDKQQGK